MVENIPEIRLCAVGNAGNVEIGELGAHVAHPGEHMLEVNGFPPELKNPCNFLSTRDVSSRRLSINNTSSENI